jgi:hypothetical protein
VSSPPRARPSPCWINWALGHLVSINLKELKGPQNKC